RAAVERSVDVGAVAQFRALPGRGVAGRVNGRRVTVERANAADSVGTVVGVFVDGEERGRIELSDQLRDGAPAAVRALGDLTAEPVHVLTGDHAAAAAQVAESCDIGSIHAELLPEDKTRIVRAAEHAGQRVLLVGDGINDAPALMAASTGIAMGRYGSDLALDAADAIITRDDLGAVPALIRLSRQARRYVVANLCIAATVIATLVTWDLVGTLPLPLAVAGHEGSTILVALNGARLLRQSAWSAG
ncbi:MAG: HAD-IC family P-type ATPase, partial [Actinomycetota bacterium]|nr:HAD-IC family P-type ATPase [Actinomycetota bacterium]